MGVGKYSPTVSSSYAKDQEWWRKVSLDDFVDPDGYDAYGYSGKYGDGPDRAGYTESDYSMGYDEFGDPVLFRRVQEEWAGRIITFEQVNTGDIVRNAGG